MTRNSLPFVEVGQRFGRLTVVEPDLRKKAQRAVLCRCDCGTETIVQLSSLRHGLSRSCGCLRREVSAARLKTLEHTERARHAATKHGKHGTPLYTIWANMIARCERPSSHSYPNYGARGIKVCPAWHDAATFMADIEASIGPRPEGRLPSGRAMYSLDRIDNDGDYEPGNVRWNDLYGQAANRRDRAANR